MTWAIGAAGVFMLAAIAAWALRSSWRQGRGLLARPEAESWQDRIDSLHRAGHIDQAEADGMVQKMTLAEARRSCPACGRLEGHRPSCPYGKNGGASYGGESYGTGSIKPW